MPTQLKIKNNLSILKTRSIEESTDRLLEKLTVSEIKKLSKINGTALKNIVSLSDNEKAIQTLSTDDGMELVQTFLS